MNYRRSTIAVMIMATTSLSAQASGILRDDTASAYLGSAGAGRATDTSAGAAFNNPAGLAYLQQREVQGTLLLIEDSFTFHDQGSTGTNPDYEQRRKSTDYGVGLSGGGSLFYGQPLGEDWGFGLALASPAGGATDFGDNWAGSNFIESVEVMIGVAQASLGYRINDQWSVGASLGVSYMSWELTLDPFPGAEETLTLDDTELAWALGLLYRPWQHTSLGLRYVAGVEHQLRGDTAMSTPMGPVHDQATQQFNLADLVTFSVQHQLTPALSLLADIEWAQWSDMDRSLIEHDNGPTILVPRNWQDAWSGALGVHYQVSSALTLKAGIAYDESAVSKVNHKLDPPVDRQIAYAAGLSWTLSPSTQLDLSYQYLDLGDIEVNQTIEGFDPIAGQPFSQTVSGHSEAHVHILSLGLAHHF